jgi:hypothetical protein
MANPLDSEMIAEAINKVGNISDNELAKKRCQMIELSKTIFAYKTDGKKLFEILSL